MFNYLKQFLRNDVSKWIQVATFLNYPVVDDLNSRIWKHPDLHYERLIYRRIIKVRDKGKIH